MRKNTRYDQGKENRGEFGEEQSSDDMIHGGLLKISNGEDINYNIFST